MKECRHKFKPRYDKVWTTVLEEIARAGAIAKTTYDGFTPYIKTETYVHDICIKCGQTKRKEK